MKQQDIVWVRMPFSSLEETKVRPAVIVSNNEYNGLSQDAIVCAITSKLEKGPYSILIDSDNLLTGKLPLKSKIRADKIMQIEKNLILKTFAKLNSETFDALVSEINKLVRR